MQMYLKLINNNTKKIFQDYHIYFVTLIISATLFYAFISLSSPRNDIVANASKYSNDMFRETINLVVYIISLIFFVLVNYVNNHMITRRSREFAIYMLLGMEQKKIAFCYFIETLLVGIVAVLMGGLFGTVLSGALTSIVLVSTEGEFEYVLRVYPDVLRDTFIFFLVVFCVAGIFNSKKLTQKKLIELMNADKISEGHIESPKRYVIGFFVFLVSTCIAIVAIKNYLAVGSSYMKNVPSVISNRYQTIIGMTLIIAVFSGCYAASFLLNLFKKKSNIYIYKEVNVVFVSNLFAKISSHSRLVAGAAIAMCISLLGFVIAPVLADIAEEYLEYRMPYSLMINNSYRYIDKLEDIPEIEYSFVEDILAKHGIEVKEACEQESYFVWKESFKSVEQRENKWDMPRLAISLSDYNCMRKMSGYEPITLKENEFVVQISNEINIDDFKQQLNSENTQITLDDGTIMAMVQDGIYNNAIGTYLYNFGNSSSLIFPDNICEELYLANTCYYANTLEMIPIYECSIIEKEIKEEFMQLYPSLYSIYESKYIHDKDYQDFIEPIRFETEEFNSVKISSVCIRLLGVYIGVVFFVICLTVLALQQLSDADVNRKQYGILYCIGVERKEIYKLVTKQVTLFFGIPCALAILGAGVGIYVFMLRFGNKIETYIGTLEFGLNIVVALILMLFIFVTYYFATIKGYRYNIENVFGTKYRKKI